MPRVFSHPVNRLLLCAVVTLKLAYIGVVWQAAQHLEALDADTWLHLTRLRELWLEGQWFDTTIPRDNTPFGITTHWSRLLDMLALPLVAALQMLMPLQSALLALPLWWNTLVLLGLLLPMMLSIAARGAHTPYAQSCILLLVGFGLFYLSLYSPRQFDYHSLLAALCVALLGCAMALAQDWQHARLAWLLGGLAALGAWLSVEFLFPVFWVMLWLASIWVRKGWIWPLQRMSLALWLGLCCAFVLEKPFALWGQVEHDSLSVVHIVATGMNAALLLLLSAYAPRLTDMRSRLLAGGGLAAVLLAVLLCLYPGLTAGALSSVHGSLAASYLWRIGELRPLHENFSGLLLVTAYLGVLAWPWCVAQWRRQVPNAEFFLLLALLYVVFAVAMALQTRWISYAVPLTTLMLALWLDDLALRHAWSARRMRWVILLFALAPLLLYAVDVKHSGQPVEQAETAPATAMCQRALEQAIREDYPSTLAGNTPQRLIVPENMGTMVLFFTPHSIVASNYHRNTEGILALERFLRAPHQQDAQAVVQARGIDMVMLCPAHAPPAEQGGYMQRVMRGVAPVPAWLMVIEHPWQQKGLFIARVQQ